MVCEKKAEIHHFALEKRNLGWSVVGKKGEQED